MSKNLLVLVEGYTEHIVLQSVLETVIEGDWTVDVKILDPKKGIGRDRRDVGGDFLSSYEVVGRDGSNKADIKLEQLVNSYLSNNRGLKFDKIIHITDTDGAYISNDDVVVDPEIVNHKDYRFKRTIDGKVAGGHPVYFDDRIVVADNPHNVTSPHATKRQSVAKLMKKDKLCKVPYELYYMSCNLEHVIDGNRNSRNKQDHAIKSQKRFLASPQEFIDIFKDQEVLVSKDYKKTWTYIRTVGTHNSLERHSNLGLLLREEVAND